MDEDAPEPALHEAAWEVYGVPPADFVATRTRWVKDLRSRKQREVAKAVAALRKPSVAAAAVNALVRAEDPAVDRLRDVGTRMRHAQSALDAQGLAALRGERDAVLNDWVEAARQHAPSPLTAAVEAEVRDTAVAALADGAATDVVLSGTLTRALSYSGFGEVDVSDAVARTSTGIVLTRIQGGGDDTGADADDLEDSDADDADPGDEDDVEVDDEEDLDVDHEDEDDVDDEDGDVHDEDEDVDADIDEDDVGDEDEPGDEEEGSEADEPGDEGDEDDQSVDPDEDEPDLSTEDGLARLEEALAEAEEQVTAARRERRSLLEAAKAARAHLAEAEEGLAEARRLLTQAENEAERAQAEDEHARAALAEADEALAAARKRRSEARTALEEAEDTE